MKPTRSAALAALAAMILIWGYSWVVMKIALRHAHPFDYAAWRVVLGAALLFAIARATGRALRLSRPGVAVLVGLLQVALFVSLSHFALLQAGPGKTSVLVFTMPFWMILFAHVLIGERMTGAQWVAVALAFGGLTLIVAPWELESLSGSLLAVAAGSVWALAAVLSKKLPIPGADPLTFTAWQLLAGGVALTLLSLFHPHESTRWTLEYLLALAYSTVIATAIGWWLWTWILSHSAAGIAGLNALGIPVVAVATSALQIGERPPPLELLGMALVLGALSLLAFLGIRDARARPG